MVNVQRGKARQCGIYPQGRSRNPPYDGGGRNGAHLAKIGQVPGRLAYLATALFVPLALAACSSDSPPAEADAGVAVDASSADAGPTYADGDWMFDPDKLLSVDIQISQENWDTLRHQSRNIIRLLGEECQDGPSYSPFTYVKAQVTIDGQVVDEVGVRKKGFLGSLSDTKPSLKIKFNEYISSQRFSGWKRMTLNNAVQDPSHMNQCLGYQLFTAAGVPAPRCSFAKVSVNGVPLGVYVHVESVKKPFLATKFDDNNGNMYEGTLSDFRTDWIDTYERKTNESVPPGSEDRSDIQAVMDAVAIPDDATMAAALGQLVDLDAFYSFWAVETMTAHWDGYGGNNNNHYIYADPTSGKFHFLPWGVDQLFGDGGNPFGPARTRSTITRRLFLHVPTRTAYVARYLQIIDDAWDENAMLAEINRIDTLIRPEIPPAQISDYDDALVKLRAAMTGREQRMRDALNNAGPGDAEALMPPLCFAQSGTADITFDTRYGGAVNALSMNIVIDGMTVPLSNQQAYSGPDEDKPGNSVLLFVADTTNNRQAWVIFGSADANFAPGTVNLTDTGLTAVLYFFPDGASEPDEVHYLGGDLTFTEAGTTPNAALKGTISARLWDPPWF